MVRTLLPLNKFLLSFMILVGQNEVCVVYECVSVCVGGGGGVMLQKYM